MNPILIIAFFILIFFLFLSKSEHIDNVSATTTVQKSPQEAIDNLTSMFNANKVTTNAMNVLQNVDVGGNITGSGITLKNNVTSSSVVSNTINTASDMLTIGDPAKALIMKQKYYLIEGIDTPGGDMYDRDYRSFDDALKVCKGDPRCDRITTNGTHHWLKGANNIDWIIGSPDWTPDVTFTGWFGGGENAGPVASFSECYKKAQDKKSKYFNYCGLKNANGADNCRLSNKGTGNTSMYIFKRY